MISCAEQNIKRVYEFVKILIFRNLCRDKKRIELFFFEKEPQKNFSVWKTFGHRCNVSRVCDQPLRNCQERRGWCPRRDSNPRPQDSSHFGLRRRRSTRRSWSGLSLHLAPTLITTFAVRCRPSSLYTFRNQGDPTRQRLGSGSAQRQAAPAFPDFERIRCTVSHRSAQFITRNPVLYPAELRGQPRAL